ncbi:coiled-coil domain-containing protein 90-like protein [Artemisia annua]|uniref:Coiled-coil domain-containing protein 90-like protein n=1 Tax=Artemisia annua TaxID=35608 RepID=A0A2U1N425_ARTAN|nr:coiled-coil domain-containing protein 90-like protein [Artemisia annua]
MEASKEGRSLADFRYGCVGYSVYSDMKNNSGDAQESEKELPVCVGIEVLVDRKVTNANSAPTHAHNKDTHAVPQPRVSRPAQGQSAADDFFSRQVRRLEGQGVPSKQAEAITSAITEVLNDSLENVAQSFVSKGEMQRIEMTQDGNLGKFKSQVQSSQENHFSLLQRETEKLRNDIEKMRSELRYEIDKVTAGQRLDLNLERGRIRDELANQNQETANLTNKLDREIHSLRAQLEAAKYDVIKYCIGTLVSISAVGLAVLRILM